MKAERTIGRGFRNSGWFLRVVVETKDSKKNYIHSFDVLLKSSLFIGFAIFMEGKYEFNIQ